MSSQIFKTQIPNEILIHLLDSIAIKTEKGYIINNNVYKKGLFNDQITNFINEIYFLFIFLSQYLRLKFLISIDKIKVDLNYRYLISFRNLLSILPTLRLCYEIKKIISIYSPKIILFTFEGHAWERALIKTIRDIDENIFIVAYQFSPITKFHYSILKN